MKNAVKLDKTLKNNRKLGSLRKLTKKLWKTQEDMMKKSRKPEIFQGFTELITVLHIQK